MEGLLNATIPSVALPEGAGQVRVIAGSFQESAGPAKTHTAINLWDLRLLEGKRVQLHLPVGQTAAVFVLSGQLRLDSGETLNEADLAIFSPQGESLILVAEKATKLLFLGGEPINEPIVGYGPFVMNSLAEIKQAMLDYQSGRMGHLS